MTDGAAERWLRQRFNPWRGVTPESLARALDEFDSGWLRRAALMWENRSTRDEVLVGALEKRAKSVARLPWSILPVDESRRAASHVEALQDFFDRRVEATDAIDLDLRGGMRMLVDQVMDSVFLGKTVHEIIWRPGRDDVGAELRHVPLYFFEQLSGRVRYTGPETTSLGQELEPGGWMVTARRRRLLGACLMCCMMKGLSLSDWLSYSDRFAQPGVHGEIDAAPDSPEWAQFEAAVAAFAAEWAAVTRTGAKINLIESGKNPNAPYEPMVERMTRTLLILCRGADLGTLSSQDGAGASLQGDESDLLLEDDCQMVSESLQRHLARPVIRHLFGEEPLAYIELQVPADTDTKAEIEVDDAMERWGIAQDPATLAERYGRTMVDAEGAGSRADAENDAAGEGDEEALAGLADMLRHAISDRARTRLYDAIREILTGGGDVARGLDELRGRLPDFLGPDPEAELAFERFSAAAAVAGWSEAGDGPAMAMQIHANGPGGPGGDIGAENDPGASESTREARRGFLAMLANMRWSKRHPAGTPKSGTVAGGRYALGKGASRAARTKPVRDQFGPLPGKHVPLTPEQNIDRARKAISFVMAGGPSRTAKRAVVRDELGEVDFPYGAPGDPSREFEGGYGLAHIEAKHPGALRDLPDVISRGDVFKHDVEKDREAKRYVVMGTSVAVVQRKGKGRSRGWLITEFHYDPGARRLDSIREESRRVLPRTLSR